MSEVFLGESAEVEVYGTPAQALLAIERGLKTLLQAERDSLQEQVDYLREVNESLGANVEGTSTVAVDQVLDSILAELGFS